MISGTDAVVICVPTPLTAWHTPDLSYLQQAAEAIRPHLRQYQLVVLESSTYPGTTKEVLLPILMKRGLVVGRDLFLAYSPERIDPGNPHYSLETIPKVISGVTERCLEAIDSLYSTVFEHIVAVSSTEAAEMAKLLENSYRFVNISFINEFASICEAMRLNAWEIIEAAGTKPYGFTAFLPGPGIGGHCIPVDPLYLRWKARHFGAESKFIDASLKVNANMPRYMVQRLKESLRVPSLGGLRLLLIGLTYKRDIGDTRESSAIETMKLLVREGAELSYYDPFVPEMRLDGTTWKSVELSEANLAASDGVIILTDHSQIAWQRIVEHAQFVYDTRNVTVSMSGRARIVRLGVGIQETFS